jgi:putative ABC transport system permease protein
MYPYDKIERAALKTPGVVRAEGWITTDGTLPEATAQTTDGGPHSAGGGHGGGAVAGERFGVLALPAETSLLRPDIVAGRGLLATDTDVIVVNTALAAKGRQMKVGDTVTLRLGPAEASLRVVGLAREPFSPPVAYISRAYFDERGGHSGLANSLRLALDQADAAALNRVKADLERSLEQEGLQVVGSNSKGDSRFAFDQHMLMIYVFLLVVSGVLGGVGGLGLMTTMSLNVLERRREMGVLRALGASPAALWLIVVAEGGVVGVLSWALAALAAWPVSKAVGDLLVGLLFKGGLDFFFAPLGLLVWLVVSVCLAVAASFLPAWHASRSSVREAVGYE